MITITQLHNHFLYRYLNCKINKHSGAFGREREREREREGEEGGREGQTN